MHIKYVINQHHFDKLKIILMLIIKFKKKSIFNTLKLVNDYFYFIFYNKEHKLFTLPCFDLNMCNI
jgi:hypothetical protein